MMYKKTFDFRRVFLSVFLLLILAVWPGQRAGALTAAPPQPRYVLLYENLYPYGNAQSDVLNLYHMLRAEGFDTFLLSAKEAAIVKIPEGADIVAVASSFASQTDAWVAAHKLRSEENIIYDGKTAFWPVGETSPRAMVCIDKVFPFSDLNRLMDRAEALHEKNISFICTLMPVYENTDMPAFDTFIRALGYVESQGGQFFIRFPVFNPDGTYSVDPRETFLSAVELYRKAGLSIGGIVLTQDQLLGSDTMFEGLNLPVVLVEPPAKKLNGDQSYFEVSAGLNKHIYLSAWDMENVNYFKWQDDSFYPKQQVVMASLLQDEKKLTGLLSDLRGLSVPILNFSLSDYASRLKNYDFTAVGETAPQEEEKSQLEQFKEKELEKIRSENPNPEKQIENLDISGYLRSVILIIFFIILILGVQLLIGRRLDIKKIFKK